MPSSVSQKPAASPRDVSRTAAPSFQRQRSERYRFSSMSARFTQKYSSSPRAFGEYGIRKREKCS